MRSSDARGEERTLTPIPVMKPWFDELEGAATAEVIRSGWVAQGPRVGEFEAALARYVESGFGIAVSSCTTGLHLALHALGIGPGDDVIVPSLSFIATANAPRFVGANPVFVDVDRASQNISSELLEGALTESTRAVIAPHQIGMPLDLDPLRSLCADRGVVLIEDAACAIGSTYKGARVGAQPGLAVFSFHPRKLLTTGEGGMIVTDDEDLAERVRRLRNHGMSSSAYSRDRQPNAAVEQYLELGFNFRMTDIQAAVGLVQLEKVPRMVERRRALAAQYNAALEDIDGLTLPSDPLFGTTNYQSYSVVLSEAYPTARNDLMTMLQSSGISSRRGVMAAHLEPAFSDHEIHLPNTEYLEANAIILPLYHQMTDDDVERVVSVVRDGATG